MLYVYLSTKMIEAINSHKLYGEITEEIAGCARRLPLLRSRYKIRELSRQSLCRTFVVIIHSISFECLKKFNVQSFMVVIDFI